MHKRLSALIALTLLAGTASAAEHDWTGWHVGLHAGHGSGSSDARVALGGQWSVESADLREHVASTWSTDLDPSGNAYGVQFGYARHFDNDLVFGVEVDYSWLGVDETRRTGAQPVPTIPGLSYDFANSIELDDMASLRATLGYAFDRHLVYATAGWARVDAEASAGVVSNGGYDKFARHDDRLDGTVFGVGYAVGFGDGWSLRVEYLRSNVDELRFDTEYQPGSTFVSPSYDETVRQDVDLDVLRVGIDYRF